jgi:hypothetical protein
MNTNNRISMQFVLKDMIANFKLLVNHLLIYTALNNNSSILDNLTILVILNQY